MISKNVQVQLLISIIKQDMSERSEYWTSKDREFYTAILRKCLTLLEDENQEENNKK